MFPCINQVSIPRYPTSRLRSSNVDEEHNTERASGEIRSPQRIGVLRTKTVIYSAQRTRCSIASEVRRKHTDVGGCLHTPCWQYLQRYARRHPLARRVPRNCLFVSASEERLTGTEGRRGRRGERDRRETGRASERKRRKEGSGSERGGRGRGIEGKGRGERDRRWRRESAPRL